MVNNNVINKIFDLYIQFESTQNILIFREILGYFTTLNEEDWNIVWDKASQLENQRTKITLYMECLNRIPSNEKYETTLLLLHSTSSFDWDEKYYLRWQIMGQLFGKSYLGSTEIRKLNCYLYKNIYEDFSKFFPDIHKIKKRNNNLVFVTVQQFLSMTHGPTKTTIDRAYILQKILNKQVIIINTAEQYGGKKVYLSSSITGNYIDTKTSEISYQDTVFPYVQFDNNMPNIVNCNEFVEFVKKYKPAYIVNIGGNSLLIDLCNKMVPVININTVPSSLAHTNAFIQVIGRKLQPKDDIFLSYLGKDRTNVIEGFFTSMLKPQTHTYTREQLDIDENAFIMTVIGARLTDEITKDFIDVLHPAFEQGALLFIIGKMDNYEDVCYSDPLFGEHAIYLGMQEDVLALMELCDLYVNPNRTGGGTSVVEAMSKGCPAVTLNRGDVALGAGPDFCVNSYEEMSKTILKYINDKSFYHQMSQKAIERAKHDMDSSKAFSEIISEFENRIKNW